MKKVFTTLFLSVCIMTAAGCTKTPSDVPHNAFVSDDLTAKIYLCDDVYRSNDTPTHGEGRITVSLTDTLELIDYDILLCGDGCEPEAVVSRASQGYAPAYDVVFDGEFSGNFKTLRFKMEMPEHMTEDLKKQGVFEHITEQIESQYYYLLVLDENHYAYLNLARKDEAEKLANEAELADSIVKNAKISFEPTKENPGIAKEISVKIGRPDIGIYKGPGYDYEDTGDLLDIGTYTITEQFVCDEGVVWGKLKSGLGWIDLDKAASEAPHIPITLERVDITSLDKIDYHLYIRDETEYTQYLLIKAYEDLTDVKLVIMDLMEEDFKNGEELYTLEKLDADKPLVLGVVFYGDFTTFGLSFNDAKGNVCQYMIYTSGRNGSVVLQKHE